MVFKASPVASVKISHPCHLRVLKSAIWRCDLVLIENFSIATSVGILKYGTSVFAVGFITVEKGSCLVLYFAGCRSVICH